MILMNKGFTLIELMGVIIILSILVMISVPIVDKYVKQTKDVAGTAQKDTLILAAKNWASDNPEGMPSSGKKTNVSFETLIELGYLDLELQNSSFEVDGKNLSIYDSIEITNNSGKYNYELAEDSSVDTTAPIDLKLVLVSSTINTLTVKASATDLESPIVKYEFNIDDEKDGSGNLVWEGGTGAKMYTFKKISEGDHSISLKVTNSKGLYNISNKFYFSTQKLYNIEFIVKDEPNDCTSARTIRIIYPANSSERGYKKTLIDDKYTEVTSSSLDIKTDNNCQPIVAKAKVENIDLVETYTIKYKKEKSDGTIETCPC